MPWCHRRRLVINMGGKNLGHKYWGGKKFGKIYFQTTFYKNFEKIPFYFLKFLRTFFSHQQLFQKMTSFIQKVLPFLCIFLSLSLFLLSFVFYFKKTITNSRLIIGGQKRGSPHLNYWGLVTGLPPESTPMLGANKLIRS